MKTQSMNWCNHVFETMANCVARAFAGGTLSQVQEKYYFRKYHMRNIVYFSSIRNITTMNACSYCCMMQNKVTKVLIFHIYRNAWFWLSNDRNLEGGRKLGLARRRGTELGWIRRTTGIFWPFECNSERRVSWSLVGPLSSTSKLMLKLEL